MLIGPKVPLHTLVLPPPPPGSLLLQLSNLHRGSYKYAEDLLALHRASPPMPVVSSKEQVISPLRSEAWAEGLKSYPDLRLTRYILEGIKHGFRIRAMAGAVFRPSVRNLRSAHEQRHVVIRVIPAMISRLVPLGSYQRSISQMHGAS